MVLVKLDALPPSVSPYRDQERYEVNLVQIPSFEQEQRSIREGYLLNLTSGAESGLA